MTDIDWTMLASHLAEELDRWELHQDYDCAVCGLSKGQHLAACPVGFLLDVRRRMVPVIRP